MPGDHDAIHEVRDPIYGFVKLTRAEWEVVNQPAFQRLRDIRQLAMAHLVYPGATHTRFEHSVGCLHLATIMFDALTERDHQILNERFGLTQDGQQRARQVLRLAALLHDVGHPPFSHTGEDLLPETTQGGHVPHRLKHEEMSARIIRESLSDPIERLFGPQGIQTVEEVIATATESALAQDFRTHPYHGFLNELLTGELGADRIDYLLRDAYHSGQKAGDFDYRRLVGSVMMVQPPEQDEDMPRIGFQEGGWLVAEQMIAARYFMYMSLYFHKTKRICEWHVTNFLQKWLPSVTGAAMFPLATSEYLRFSDSDVWTAVKAAARDASAVGHEEANRLVKRTHLRLAREVILAENMRATDDHRRLPHKERFDKLREHVRIKFGSMKVHCDEPDHSATKMFGDKMLIDFDGTPKYLADVSEVVRGMSDRIWRGRVYAEPCDRAAVRKFCDDWLARNPVAAQEQGGSHVQPG